jgi:hypothetical protein
MKRRDLLRHLLSEGGVLLREGGSQSIVLHVASGRQTPVPRHREIPEPLVRVICRQLGVRPP